MVCVWHLVLRSLLALIIVSSLVCCNSREKRANTPGKDAGNTGNTLESQGSPTNSAAAEEARNLIESRESPYNNIYVYRTGTNLSMTFGLNQKIYTESIYNTLDDRDLPVPYTQFMTSSLIYAKQVKSILEIGSGGGRTSWYLHRYLPDVQITSVELDPSVVELAYKYFGIKDEPNFRVINRDGRIFLAGSKAKYDVILIDAYRGPFVPFHLLTKEFYQIVKGHLTEGGVMALNVEPTTMLFDSAVYTLHEVFPQIEFYDANGDNKGGSVVLIAYDGPEVGTSDLTEMAKHRQFKYALRYDLRAMLVHRFLLKTIMNGDKVTFGVIDQSGNSTAGINENAKVLTDDFAPVESLKAIEKHNKKWEQTVPQ